MPATEALRVVTMRVALLRGACLLLLAVFALPACVTPELWARPGITRSDVGLAERAVVERDGSCLALRLRPSTVRELRGFVPELTEEQPWLQLRPRRDREAVARWIASAGRVGGDAAAGSRTAVLVFATRYDYVHVPTVLVARGVEIEVDVVPEPPDEGLVDWPLGPVRCVVDSIPDPGMSTGVRVLLTPPAVALDVVLAPVYGVVLAYTLFVF